MANIGSVTRILWFLAILSIIIILTVQFLEILNLPEFNAEINLSHYVIKLNGNVDLLKCDFMNTHSSCAVISIIPFKYKGVYSVSHIANSSGMYIEPVLVLGYVRV